MITPPQDDRIYFEINFLQYSDNNYFIDEVYADTSAELNIFNLFYGTQPPIVRSDYFVMDIEVYLSINVITPDTNIIFASAYINLPPRSSSALYPDSLRNNNNPIPSEEENARFVLLKAGIDYIFHNETGYITFLFPVTDQDVIAVAYRIPNNNPADSSDYFTYGEFYSEIIDSSKTSAVLKLVKPKYLKPQYETAWKLKMRNRYTFTNYRGQIANLDLDIYLKKAEGTETNTINNVGLLKLFGFDQIKTGGAPGSDGKFDIRPGYNYDPRTSEIIFHVIEPFGNNISPMLNDYKYQAIYDTLKAYLSLPANYFVIKGKYKPM